MAYISSETGREYFFQFCKDIIEMYGTKYMRRRTTESEFVGMENKYKRKGFPGCFGSIDSSNIFWKNCSMKDKRQYLNIKRRTFSIESLRGMVRREFIMLELKRLHGGYEQLHQHINAFKLNEGHIFSGRFTF